MCSQYLAFFFYLLGEIMAKYAAITGWGMAVPERVLTNAELERISSLRKKALELALREARHLGHGSIGTEHLLLGMVREGEGVAAEILSARGATPRRVRAVVVSELTEPGDQPGRSA